MNEELKPEEGAVEEATPVVDAEQADEVAV